MKRGTLALLLTLACSPKPEPQASATPETPAVTLERTPCFGFCPVYRLEIFPSGTVRFEGKHHVAQMGDATDTIPVARVDSLLKRLEAGGYFEFADAYLMDEPACGRYATDSPTVITSVSVGGKNKTIRHDYGCEAAPAELRGLEQLVDSIAGSSRWIGERR